MRRVLGAWAAPVGFLDKVRLDKARRWLVPTAVLGGTLKAWVAKPLGTAALALVLAGGGGSTISLPPPTRFSMGHSAVTSWGWVSFPFSPGSGRVDLATASGGPPACLCFLAAVQIHILKADKAGDWWKFTVNIISVYKQGTSRIRRGDQSLWIRSRDIACKCPKIKPLKKYLLLGNAEDSPDQSGIVADKSSLVIQWRDTWARRLRKFQQREKKGKCKKA